jgi:hypothetical protein
MKAGTTSLILSAVAIGACAASFPIDGAPCPCTQGWTCCSGANICVENGTACPSSDAGSNCGLDVWSDNMATGITQQLNSVWGASASDIWAMGLGGLALHWTGLEWKVVPSGTCNSLLGVWGSSAADVWAVGYVGASGTILHWDGSGWSPVATGVGGSFLGVWGTGPNDVWIVGWTGAGRGVILHHGC